MRLAACERRKREARLKINAAVPEMLLFSGIPDRLHARHCHLFLVLFLLYYLFFIVLYYFSISYYFVTGSTNSTQTNEHEPN